MRFFFIAICAALAVQTSTFAGTKLKGLLVIIDPGHGGRDDGASALVEGQRVVEDEHCYDTALRVRDMIIHDGGKAVLTVEDPGQTKPIDNPAGRWLKDRTSVRITGGGCGHLEGG